MSFKEEFQSDFSWLPKMVSALDSGSSGPGSSPGWVTAFFVKQDTFLSQCLSPSSCVNGYRRIPNTEGKVKHKLATVKHVQTRASFGSAGFLPKISANDY